MKVMYFVGYLASLSVLSVLKLSDALVSSMVTCTRKVLSIVFSFVAFSKVVTGNHIVGGSIFFIGLAMQIYFKYQKKEKKHKH